ncbi:hypothetical protein JL720_16946 [Aureococcus anophagefferens]|nr:hypothetical protein JL720_16946 [Aureococcus anophagefferens]
MKIKTVSRSAKKEARDTADHNSSRSSPAARTASAAGTSRAQARLAPAHAGPVAGVVLARAGDSFFSCGERSIKRWALEVAATSGGSLEGDERRGGDDRRPEPLNVWTSRGTVNDVDASWQGGGDGALVSCGSEGSRTVGPGAVRVVRSWSWGTDAVYKARWNPAEPSLVASTSRDRAATLYDTRRRR